jgi:hypothetical protein
MAVSLTGVFSDLGNLIPSQTDVLNSVLAGAAGTVVLSGLQSNQGQDAVDPLHLFHHAATATTPAVTGAVTGNVMSMSAFLALTPDQQKMIQALKYTIIPG